MCVCVEGSCSFLRPGHLRNTAISHGAIISCVPMFESLESLAMRSQTARKSLAGKGHRAGGNHSPDTREKGEKEAVPVMLARLVKTCEKWETRKAEFANGLVDLLPFLKSHVCG